jgi:hypothetical protein
MRHLLQFLQSWAEPDGSSGRLYDLRYPAYGLLYFPQRLFVDVRVLNERDRYFGLASSARPAIARVVSGEPKLAEQFLLNAVTHVVHGSSRDRDCHGDAFRPEEPRPYGRQR